MTDPFARSQLGTTAVSVPKLGLGTAPLGGWPEAVDHDTGVATVQRAWDAGIRYFDTAPFYGFGQSETFLGEVLSTVPRWDFVLSTKVGRLLREGAMDDPFYKGAAPFTPVADYSPDAIRASLDASRKRLGFDRIDIALIHDPDDHHEQALTDSLPALSELKRDGIIGAVGVGMNWTEPLAAFAVEGEFDAFLLAGRYTLLEQEPLDELFPAVAARGMSIIAGGVYNGGVLADPEGQPYYNYAPAPPEVVERAKRIAAVCDAHDVPLRAAAIQFPLAHPAVATVVIGSRTPGQMDENIALMSHEIPTALWDDLKDKDLIRPDAPTP